MNKIKPENLLTSKEAFLNELNFVEQYILKNYNIENDNLHKTIEDARAVHYEIWEEVNSGYPVAIDV